MPDSGVARFDCPIDVLSGEVAVGVGAEVQSRQAASSTPAEIQYMPPGRHRIHAHQGDKGVTLDVEVTADTATHLERALRAALTDVEGGRGDRPYFDFNHEDREAAGWPISFRWAGDDAQAGGVRVQVDWSEAGRRAIEGRTFRRFSPSFFVQDSRVTGAPINMGGLVNRAAFRSIQPLFARDSAGEAGNFMSPLVSELRKLGIANDASDDATAVREACVVIAKLRTDLDAAGKRVGELERERADAIKARATTHVDAAIRAGRIHATDAKAREFWTASLIADETAALHVLGSLSSYSVLTPVTAADDNKSRPTDQMVAQQRKLAEIRAANPDADFATIFAKAQAEAPELFH